MDADADGKLKLNNQFIPTGDSIMLPRRLPKVQGSKKIVGKNLMLVSTGLPSLDVVIGGGIPVGSCFLIEEDAYMVHSDIILKHYLAEGVVNGHSLFIASLDMNTYDFINELPRPIINTSDKNESKRSSAKVVKPASDNGQLRIAWRYQNLPNDKFSDVSAKPSVFGNTFNMGKYLKTEDFKSITVDHYNLSASDDHTYDSLFEYIERIVKKPQYDFNSPVENRTLLRIALHSLASPCWEGDLNIFLIRLRWLIFDSGTTCVITMSTQFFKDLHMTHSCEHFSDTVIQVKSLLNDASLAYRDYDGLLIVKKLPSINSWCPIVPESNDWAFKTKKKHFIIEKLHISPEDQEHVHREEEDLANDYNTRQIIANVANEF